MSQYHGPFEIAQVERFFDFLTDYNGRKLHCSHEVISVVIANRSEYCGKYVVRFYFVYCHWVLTKLDVAASTRIQCSCPEIIGPTKKNSLRQRSFLIYLYFLSFSIGPFQSAHNWRSHLLLGVSCAQNIHTTTTKIESNENHLPIENL